MSKLEAHIDQSDAVLIVVTDKYLSSYNCRRELAAAMRFRHLGKPLILLRESDETKGATSVTRLHAELADLKLAGKFSGTTLQQEEEGRLQLQAAEQFIRALEVPQPGVTVIQYHREKHLRLAALKTIAATIYVENAQHHSAVATSYNCGSTTNANSRLRQLANWTPQQTLSELRLYNEKPPPPLRQQAAVYMNSRYRAVRRPESAMSYFDEVAASLRLYGIQVVAQPLGVLPTVVLLFPDSFSDTRIAWMIRRSFQKHTEMGKRLTSRFSSSRVETITDAPPLIALYCTSVPFSFYLDSCPSDLKELGIFRYLYNKWPDGELLQLATACIVAESLQGHLDAHRTAIDVALQSMELDTEAAEADRWQSESPRSPSRSSVGITDRMDGEDQSSFRSPNTNRQGAASTSQEISDSSEGAGQTSLQPNKTKKGHGEATDYIEPVRLPAPGHISAARHYTKQEGKKRAASPGGHRQCHARFADMTRSHLAHRTDHDSSKQSTCNAPPSDCSDDCSSMREGGAARCGSLARRSHLGDHTCVSDELSMRDAPPTHRGLSSATTRAAPAARRGSLTRPKQSQGGAAVRRRSLTCLKEVVAARKRSDGSCADAHRAHL